MMIVQKEQTVNAIERRSEIDEILESFLQGKFLPPKDVEFVCIINKQGKIVESVSRKKIKISEEKMEMFSMCTQLQASMQSDFDDEFGQICHTITERENARFVSIPTHAGMVLAKVSKSMDSSVLVNKITAMTDFHKTLLKTSNRVL